MSARIFFTHEYPDDERGGLNDAGPVAGFAVDFARAGVAVSFAGGGFAVFAAGAGFADACFAK